MSNVCVVGIEKSEEPAAALGAADAQGEIDLDTACMVLRWYELRRRIERFFHALKFGSRLELAGDLRKCLPFDAITAFRVWDIPILARARRDDPTGRRVSGDDIRALCALASRYGFKVPGGPPEMTIAGFVVLTGGLAGFLPSKRQVLPGTQKLWEGIRLLSLAVTAIHAMRVTGMFQLHVRPAHPLYCRDPGGSRAEADHDAQGRDALIGPEHGRDDGRVAHDRAQDPVGVQPEVESERDIQAVDGPAENATAISTGT